MKKLLAENCVFPDYTASTFSISKEFNNDSISSEDLKQIIKISKNTAPGINRISYKLIKLLTDDQIEILAKLLTKMCNHSSFPSHWNLIKVIPIKKPNKEGTETSDYRIISLLNVIYKIFNKHLKNIFSKIITRNNLLPENSFGFRNGIGINEFSTVMVNQLELNKQTNYITAVISIDLEKAFDKVNTNVLLNRLKTMKFPNKYIYWIKEMLSNRNLVIEHLNHKAEITLNNGVPQGDVLSPLLFNLYSTIIHTLQTDDIKIFQYADDFSILVRDKTAASLNLKANRILCSLKILLQSLNFTINFTKCKYMCLNLRPFQFINISIFNDIIKEEQDIKILGIIFDNKINFVKHL